MATDVCDHGRPSHEGLVCELAEALGVDPPARADPPAQVWAELLDEVRELTIEGRPLRDDERHGAPHNLVAHPLLVLWPRWGLWLHNRTDDVVRRRLRRRPAADG